MNTKNDDQKTTDNPEAKTPDGAELGARNCSAADITKWDVQALSDILDAWNAISNVDKLEDGYAYATDHCHDIYDAGWELLTKLQRIVSEQPNAAMSHPHKPEGEA